MMPSQTPIGDSPNLWDSKTFRMSLITIFFISLLVAVQVGMVWRTGSGLPGMEFFVAAVVGNGGIVTYRNVRTNTTMAQSGYPQTGYQ